MKFSPSPGFSVALTRSGKINVFHQMFSKSCAPGLLDVKKHHHISFARQIEHEVVLEYLFVGDHVLRLFEVHVVNIWCMASDILNGCFILSGKEEKNSNNNQY